MEAVEAVEAAVVVVVAVNQTITSPKSTYAIVHVLLFHETFRCESFVEQKMPGMLSFVGSRGCALCRPNVLERARTLKKFGRNAEHKSALEMTLTVTFAAKNRAPSSSLPNVQNSTDTSAAAECTRQQCSTERA